MKGEKTNILLNSMKFGIVTENKIYAKNTVYKANVSTFEIT
jgi:hypothetical protein